MRRSRPTLFAAMIALWQLATLLVCVAPARATAPNAGASSCCGTEARQPSHPDAPLPTTCTHCTNGVGHFADPPTTPPDVTPIALTERLSIVADPAPSQTTFDEVEGSLHPPDPTLYALRCALIR